VKHAIGDAIEVYVLTLIRIADRCICGEDFFLKEMQLQHYQPNTIHQHPLDNPERGERLPLQRILMPAFGRYYIGTADIKMIFKHIRRKNFGKIGLSNDDIVVHYHYAIHIKIVLDVLVAGIVALGETEVLVVDDYGNIVATGKTPPHLLAAAVARIIVNNNNLAVGRNFQEAVKTLDRHVQRPVMQYHKSRCHLPLLF
jgi:hypothetical protein